MRIRNVVVATALSLSTAGIGLVTVPAFASVSKPPKFSGAAPGAVTCSLSAKVKFATPLTVSGGGTSSTVKGKLKDCRSTTTAVVIKRATLTGSFSGSPIDCRGPSSGTATGTFTIDWKGTVDGVARTATYKGNATFTASPVETTGDALITNGGGQVGLQILGADSGSFPGGVSLAAYSPDTGSELTGMCETRTTTPSGRGRGIRTLSLTGEATAGSVGQVVSDGSGSCAALSSGAVDCWGSGTDGALGNNSTADARVPVIINVTTATGLASDGSHSYCAVVASGSVECWGLNTDGELGNGSDASDSLVPVTVIGVAGAIGLSSDGNHSYCALLVDGGVDCWGLGTSGELGNGAESSTEVAVAVSGLDNAVTLGGEGDGSYCVATSGGLAECWGDNGSGDLGNNSTTDSDVPVMVSGLTGVTSVVSDGSHSYCALSSGGAINCWGLGTDGELGNGAGSTSHVPVTVTGLPAARSLASDGNRSYCATLDGGAVECWGLGTQGQLGNDGTASSPSPVPVTGIGDAESVAGDGVNSYCAVLAGEAVECWGVGTSGQLGNGAGATSDVPVPAAPMGAAVSLVGEASDTFCAVLASNSVDCWGSNGGGALGDGSAGSQSDSPVTVSDLAL